MNTQFDHKNHPNIIFVLSDDQGAWSLGSYGNKDAITKTLDNFFAQAQFAHLQELQSSQEKCLQPMV